VQDAVSAHERPNKRNLMIRVGVHSGTAGIGWLGPATMRCEELCDAAEAGHIFLFCNRRGRATGGPYRPPD
jgi:hypothetical protein